MSRRRPDFCRFYPASWRRHTVHAGLSLEAEGLLSRIAMFNMETGVPLPACRTTVSRMLHLHRNKLDKLLDDLVARQQVCENETGIYSPRALVEHQRAAAQFEKGQPAVDHEASPEQPRGNLGATSGQPRSIPPSSHEKIVDISTARSKEERRGEERRKDPPPPPRKRGGCAGVSDADFDAFARVFPRRRWNGPAVVKPALAKALATGVSIDVIVAAVRNGHGLEPDPEKAPAAEVWLNQQRWSAAPRRQINGPSPTSPAQAPAHRRVVGPIRPGPGLFDEEIAAMHAEAH